jgi:threonine dehydrogenase-like Zn-dependent dehydrogenase
MMSDGTSMKASTLVDIGRVVTRDVPRPRPGRRDVLVEIEACGVCGSDFHIFTGEGNWNLDEDGHPIPPSIEPQVLGHEITGTVREIGQDVEDLEPGDRVVLDQGISCVSAARDPLCEYCSSGSSHLCERYAEHGITGLPGGFAEYIVMPAVNAIRIGGELSFEAATLTEPVACILRALDRFSASGARYRFDAPDEIQAIRTVVIAGGGPAGQIFLQLLRNMVGFDGTIILSDPVELKRSMAERFGAIAVGCEPGEVLNSIPSGPGRRRAELVIDASGAGAIWKEVPTWICKQAGILMYGYGRRGASMERLNELQWREPIIVTPAGASGGFDGDGRPSVYRRALHLIEEGTIDAEILLTHRYHDLDQIQKVLEEDMSGSAYLKGVVCPNRPS